MRLTRFGHACVRIDTAEGAVVIDPGDFSPDADLDGAADILVTHQHADHIEVDRVSAAVRAGARLHTHAVLARRLADEYGVAANAVAPGDTFSAAGLQVRVVGGEHAEIYDGEPGCANVGFVIGGVYHPGDALHVPDVEVETLLVPVSGPWLKLGEALAFVRTVRPARAIPIHDALLSAVGNRGVDRWMGMKADTDYRRLAAGESLEV
jgi:L-ascorbate metabolism protein UlaG (beta-lactamase superfamily)